MTHKQLAIYALAKLAQPRSIGHLIHGWGIIATLAFLGAGPAIAVGAGCYIYQIVEEWRLINAGDTGDNDKALAAIDFYGIMAGMYQGVAVWAIVRLAWLAIERWAG